MRAQIHNTGEGIISVNILDDLATITYEVDRVLVNSTLVEKQTFTLEISGEITIDTGEDWIDFYALEENAILIEEHIH